MSSEQIQMTEVKDAGNEESAKNVVSNENMAEKFKTVEVTVGNYVDRGYWYTFYDQLVIMLRRNFTLQKRYWITTFAQVFAVPFIFFLLLFLLQLADTANQNKTIDNPASYPLEGIKECIVGKAGYCITTMFTPQTTESSAIMNIVANKNKQRAGWTMNLEEPITDVDFVPSKKNLGMVPVPDQAFIYDYTVKHPNSTYFGVVFEKVPGPPLNFRYTIWYNYTLVINTTYTNDIFSDEILSYIRALDEAIITYVKDPTATNVAADLDVTLKDWPVVPPAETSQRIVAGRGPLFFFCGSMVIFFQVLNTIVQEKDLKLRRAMETMGLKGSAYWLSWFITYGTLVVGNSFVCTIFGYVFQFEVFKGTNFGIVLVTYLLFGWSTVCFAFFLTTIIRRSTPATLTGIFVFILGLLFEALVFSTSFTGYIWYEPELLPPIVWILLATFLPLFNFGRMFLDFATLTTGKFDSVSETYRPGPGFNSTALTTRIIDIDKSLLPTLNEDNGPVDPPPAGVTLWFFVVNMVVYALLTWYFDNVIPDDFGNSRPLWFFLTPSYWGLSGKKQRSEATWIAETKSRSVTQTFDDEDNDVTKERSKVENVEIPFGVRILNLRKVYRSGWFGKSRFDKVAVKSLNLTLEKGKCLALLGQNGAGKSTTINMLCGMTPASSGDALVFGNSVKDNMSEIQKIMGVCPQHDVLFQDLTAAEHIELYGGLKGLTREEINRLIEERLAAVRLYKVKDQRAGTYSGGMKRRLSMIISTIGDPKIVFMDEPTTGMDPVNRRHVWSFIEKFKQGRIIVLTTHSMEEADVLGDCIGVMAHGRLRAIGTSLALKTKFGSGYRVSVVTTPAQAPVIKSEIEATIPGAHCEDDSAGALIYLLPPESLSHVPEFVSWAERKHDEKAIGAWGLSQTTLEEVFLKLIRDANVDGYKGYEVEKKTEPETKKTQ